MFPLQKYSFFLLLIFLYSCEYNNEKKDSKNPQKEGNQNENVIDTVPKLINSKKEIKSIVPPFDTIPFTFEIPNSKIRTLQKERRNPSKRYNYDQHGSRGRTNIVTIISNNTSVLLYYLAKRSHGNDVPCHDLACTISDELKYDKSKLSQYYLIDDKSKKDYFGKIKDKIYLLDSYRWPEIFNRNILYTYHFLFNEETQEYFILTLNKKGDLLDKKKIFQNSSTTERYEATLNNKSVISISKTKRTPVKNSNYWEIRKEVVARFYLDTKGNILNWTSPDVFTQDLKKYFAPLDSSDLFKMNDRTTSLPSLIPLPLNLELQLIRNAHEIHNKKRNSFFRNISNDFTEAYFLTYFNKFSFGHAFTVLLDFEYQPQLYLFLTDFDGNYLDHLAISDTHREERWVKSISNDLLELEIKFKNKIFLDSVLIDSKGKLISQYQPKTYKVPTDSLAKYFYEKNIWRFDIANHSLRQKIFEQKYNFPSQVKDVFSKMTYDVHQNENWYGHNYVFNNAQNGNKYLIIANNGNYDSYLNLYVINKHGELNPNPLTISSNQPDEGSYYYSYGHFENDSTFILSSIENEIERRDSSIIKFLIKDDGYFYKTESRLFQKISNMDY